MSKSKVITLGCRINIYESEILKEKLEEFGFDNVVIINSCAVTSEAERQCRQEIRKARKEYPDAQIILTGCAAQINAKKYEAMPELDMILGNVEKVRLEEFLKKPQNEKAIVADIMEFKETDDYLVTEFDGKAKAFVQIQQGCDNRCTYCIIPYARGNNRSAAPEKIIKQIKEFVASGFQEIVITGIDIGSYKPNFSDLVEKILLEAPELKRLRLGSMDPAAIDDKLINLFEKFPTLMSHMHLSIQAGDNMILKRMNRRHLREDVIEVCKKLRDVRPDMSFGSDFICGFPTETDEMFENTLKLIDETEITHIHVFPYSEREGTPAALMPQIDVSIRKARAKILREKANEAYRKYLESLIGTETECLAERENGGHIDNSVIAIFDKPQKAKDIVRVKITGIDGNKLLTEVID